MAGFLKPSGRFRKWELKGLQLSGGDVGDAGPDNGTVCVVQGGREVHDGLPAADGDFAHHGFVGFDEGASPAFFCVSLRDEPEGSFFMDNCINVSDMFQGSVNLEASRLEHVL
jgi:hypothetical protein